MNEGREVHEHDWVDTAVSRVSIDGGGLLLQ